jgi:PEP-CTERM motif
MSRHSLTGLTLALSLFSARPAAAGSSFIDYTSQCAGATFATCASVQVFTRSIPGGTYVEIRIRNQMAPGNVINSWNIYERRSGAWGGFNPWGNFFVGPVGRVGQIGPDPMSGLDMSNGSGVWDPEGHYLSNLYGYLLNSGVVGCDNNLPIPVDDQGPLGAPRPGGFLQTCARDGYDGWFGFRFTLETRITASDVVLDYVGGHRYGMPPVSVTPEPGTMVLLASGLAGIAGFRKRRKLL